MFRNTYDEWYKSGSNIWHRNSRVGNRKDSLWKMSMEAYIIDFSDLSCVMRIWIHGVVVKSAMKSIPNTTLTFILRSPYHILQHNLFYFYCSFSKIECYLILSNIFGHVLMYSDFVRIGSATCLTYWYQDI